MNEAVYEVRERHWPSVWPRLKRPWELLRDGKPVGFYKSKEEAESMKIATLAAIEQKKEEAL